ncbi:hypothetical protein GCM10009612_73130 [Streptomyces beijiangensis]
MILGSLLGGLLTQAFGWASVFYVNVPLAALAALLAFPLIAPDAPRATGRTLDLAGALTSTVGITLIVFALVQGPESGWGSATVVGAALLGAVLLGAFIAIERRSSGPLLPLRLLRDRDLTTGTLITFLYMGTFGTLLYFLTVYFQSVHGYGAMRTGMAFLVPMLAIAAGSQGAGRLATRHGIRAIMIASLVVGGLGAATVGATVSVDGSYLALVPGLILLGIGQGAGYTLMFGAATRNVAPADQGIASGLASTSQQIGGAMGLALMVAVANSGLPEASSEEFASATTDGLRTAIWCTVAGIVLTTIAAFRLRKA